MPPGDFTDSVDADDGVIDGDGRSGHAFRSGVDFIIDTLPPIHTFQLTFEFDSAVLGYLPNSFGVTWTDGPPESSFSLLLTTGIGETVSSEVIRRVGDTSRNGETAEDFFLGVIAPSGIAEITVRGSFVGELQDSAYIEIDHLQYGRIVPEPATTVLMCWVSYAACSSRLRRAR